MCCLVEAGTRDTHGPRAELRELVLQAVPHAPLQVGKEGVLEEGLPPGQLQLFLLHLPKIEFPSTLETLDLDGRPVGLVARFDCLLLNRGRAGN